jgi:hypothetical protein
MARPLSVLWVLCPMPLMARYGPARSENMRATLSGAGDAERPLPDTRWEVAERSEG